MTTATKNVIGKLAAHYASPPHRSSDARPRAAREANPRAASVGGGDEEPKRTVLRLGDATPSANRGVRVRRARGRRTEPPARRRRGVRRG